MLIVLSHYQAASLLAARPEAPTHVTTSLDLNLNTTTVPVTATGVMLPDGQQLAWEVVEEIAANENACYHVRDNGIEKIQFFSEEFNRVYSLYPTPGAPTMLAAGFPMHRIKGIDPHRDTLEKIKAIRPLTGRVLDTTMGLGYTAIQAAQTAQQVVTIELDPTVLEICRLNPWSQALFNSPNIERRIGDSYEEIENFPAGSFSCVIHDPPTFSLAGDLYSLDFYRQLYRVLAGRGRLFHYLGDLKSRSVSGLLRGVTRRLQEAGFQRVVPRPAAFGVVAFK